MRASLYLPMNNLAFNQLKLITTKCISLCQAEAGAVRVCIPLAMKGESRIFPKCNQFNVCSLRMWENISYERMPRALQSNDGSLRCLACPRRGTWPLKWKSLFFIFLRRVAQVEEENCRQELNTTNTGWPESLFRSLSGQQSQILLLLHKHQSEFLFCEH